MTTNSPTPLDSSAIADRLAQYNEAINGLPEKAPQLASLIGADGELDQLGASIVTLANRLAQQQKAEDTLAAITQQVVEGFQLDQILDHIYDGFRGLLPYDRIGCALLEENGTVLRARWARSESSTLHLTGGYAENIVGKSLEAVIRSGRPRILNDLEERSRQQPITNATQLVMKEGVRSSLTCPLISMGRPVGVLFFSSRHPHQYAEMHIEMFLQIAGIISTTIEKSVLYDRLNAANEALRKAYDEMERQATHDALTGIKNRRAILQHLAEVQRRGHRAALAAGVVLIDIDHFKLVNDTHGHAAGDTVLKEVAQRIASALRAGDEVGRYGGEEFLACVAGASPDDVACVAGRILQAVRSRPVMVGDQLLAVTASAGVAHRADIGTADVEAMVREADEGLYRAKAAGRNRFEAAVAEG